MMCWNSLTYNTSIEIENKNKINTDIIFLNITFENLANYCFSYLYEQLFIYFILHFLLVFFFNHFCNNNSKKKYK